MRVEGIWKKPHLSKKSQSERGEGIKCLNKKIMVLRNVRFSSKEAVSFSIQDDISN